MEVTEFDDIYLEGFTYFAKFILEVDPKERINFGVMSILIFIQQKYFHTLDNKKLNSRCDGDMVSTYSRIHASFKEFVKIKRDVKGMS